MTNEQAIKYLQQLYPNGGHCWLDEQRIEAISMAVKALQEEPVASKVLEDMLNAKTAAESLGISQEEHDKIVDELIYGKEPELVDVDDLPNKEEEPVSEEIGNYNHTAVLEGLGYQSKEEPVSDECIYNRTLEEKQRSCKFCSAACQVRIKEPVNEDLDEAAMMHFKDVMEYEVKTGLKMANITSFKAGAKWQLNQIRKENEKNRD